MSCSRIPQLAPCHDKTLEFYTARITCMVTSQSGQHYSGRSKTSPQCSIEHSIPLNVTNKPSPKAASSAAHLHQLGWDLERPKNSRIPCLASFLETFLDLKSRVQMITSNRSRLDALNLTPRYSPQPRLVGTRLFLPFRRIRIIRLD
jgi:hypothetical protein